MSEIDNNGIGAIYATFYVDDSIDVNNVGDAVVSTGNNSVGLGRYGAPLLGRLEYVKDNKCTVQISGVSRFKYTDSPFLGKGVVVFSDGTVFYDPDSDDLTGKVINIDFDNKTCDVIL